MEFYLLNDGFRPEEIIEGFESLVWVDRFNDIGDFKAVLPLTHWNTYYLQTNKYVGIDKSDRIMKIETVEKTMDEDGVRKLSVSGRSLELMFTRRVVWSSKTALGSDPEWSVSGTPASIITNLVDDALISDSRPSNNIPYAAIGSSSIYPTDTIIPYSSSITVSVDKPMSLFEYIQDIAKKYSLGFRLCRHPIGEESTFPLIYYATYAGSNRTVSQYLTTTPIVFSVELDNIATTTDIKSVQPTYTGCYVWGKYGYTTVYPTGYNTNTPAGLDRALFSIVVTEPSILTTEAAREAYRIQKGKEALKERKDLEIFDGEVPQVINYIYNKDYFLGDLVTVQDEDGNNKTLRVVEQILSEDSEGEKSYPTFAVDNII